MSRVLLDVAAIALWMLAATVLFAAAIRSARNGEDYWAGFNAAMGVLAVATAQDVT